VEPSALLEGDPPGGEGGNCCELSHIKHLYRQSVRHSCTVACSPCILVQRRNAPRVPLGSQGGVQKTTVCSYPARTLEKTAMQRVVRCHLCVTPCSSGFSEVL